MTNTQATCPICQRPGTLDPCEWNEDGTVYAAIELASCECDLTATDEQMEQFEAAFGRIIRA